MSSNNVGHLFASTIITLQHFATLHHTSPNYTSLHLSTLHFLSLTLHYPLIWLNPLTFLIVLFPLTSLNQTQYGCHIPKLISKIINPFPALKNLSPIHSTSFFSLCYINFLYPLPCFFLSCPSFSCISVQLHLLVRYICHSSRHPYLPLSYIYICINGLLL